MTQEQEREALDRITKREWAFKVIAAQTGHARALVQIIEKSKPVSEGMEAFRYVRSQDRLTALLKLFDIWAKAILPLVRTPELQSAFRILVNEYARDTWKNYIGFSLEEMPPTGPLEDEWKPIAEKSGRWVLAGYRALAKIEDVTTSAMQTGKASPRSRNSRQPKTELLTNRNGSLNRSQAAEALGVSERQFDRLKQTEHLVGFGPTTRKRYQVQDIQRLLRKR